MPDQVAGLAQRQLELIMAHKVTALISGMVGGNAREVLLAAGIHLYSYRAGGTIKDALDQFNKKTLERVA